MKKLVLIVLWVLLLVNLASAATISGIIYDISLDKVESAIVEIDTTPKQTFVATGGVYTFTLGPGSYTIKASSPELQSSAEETVVISHEGDFTVDLVLFPSLDDSILDTGVDLAETNGKVTLVILLLILVLLIVAVFILVLLYKRGYRLPRPKRMAKRRPKDRVRKVEELIKKEEQKKVKEKKGEGLSKDLREVIEIIEKGGGRTTQKDIRKQHPMSEAKVSLMIAELEEKGIVKKIKKGRGNIIILEKK